ncbi:MAG: polymer-forming cytoskeletal protein [Candidatus Saganbacteria bacterium]|nr:polymer-forming cytoskeletal protein [Candidatus Saganbacteria bacterium]
MGIFGGEVKQSASGSPVDTIIGQKAKFKGEINTSGTLSISGEFEGRLVSSNEVIIGKGSKVTGNVAGGSVIVSGHVSGNITALGSLEITKSGRVHGDLAGGRIVIEEGAAYRGKVSVETGSGAIDEADEEAGDEIEIIEEKLPVQTRL